MQKAIGALLIGLIIGVALPVRAHHATSTNALRRRVVALERDMEEIQTDLQNHRACRATVVSITRYVGYQTETGTTTALDSTHEGDPRHAWMQTVADECVTNPPASTKFNRTRLRAIAP